MDSRKIIELVKQLREETGAGVMECKKALERSGGDLAKAKKEIEKMGFAKAAKKANRETSQGYVATYTHSNGKTGVIVEILSESDFVAKNEQFRLFTKNLCLQITAMNPKNIDELLSQEYIREPEKTIGDLVKETIAKFGENIKIGRFERYEIS
ncbi:MAG: translation elongation factor Ts [Patescibacteria group bacterium]